MAQPAKKSLDVPTEELSLIGLHKYTNSDGDTVYQNIVITIDNGQIIAIDKLDPCYSESSAINEATGWIDGSYYDS